MNETVLDAPANPPLNYRKPPPAHRFTPANARIFAAKAQEARIKRREAVKKLEAIVAKTTPQSEEIAQEMARLLGLMRKTSDADKLQKLSAARSRLLSEWQVLTGTPNPGSAKSKHSSKPAMIHPEPIPETPKS